MSDSTRKPIGSTEHSTAPRSRPGIALLIAVWLICASALASLIAGENVLDILRFGPLTALVGYGAWLVLWSPTVTVSPATITVRNLLRTFTIPWGAVTQVSTRYTLTLYTTARKVVVWAAPAPTTRRGGVRPSGQSPSGYPIGRMGRSRMPAMESGRAALSVRDYWEQVRDSGNPRGEATSDAQVVGTWLVIEAAILGGLVVISAAALVLVHS
ncbi:MAG TPA: PH domain-containing protein [Galbitalea sp.]